MKTSTMFVSLPREEAFKRVLEHVQAKRYLLVWRKREYNVAKAVFPSFIEVRMGASWGAMGKMNIEFVACDRGSSIQMNFELVGGKTEAVGCGLLVFLAGMLKIFLLPIVGLATSPIFLSFIDVYSAKDELITELKQLFTNHTSLPNIKEENR